jgi:hypothetical protein
MAKQTKTTTEIPNLAWLMVLQESLDTSPSQPRTAFHRIRNIDGDQWIVQRGEKGQKEARILLTVRRGFNARTMLNERLNKAEKALLDAQGEAKALDGHLKAIKPSDPRHRDFQKRRDELSKAIEQKEAEVRGLKAQTTVQDTEQYEFPVDAIKGVHPL